MLPLNVDMKHAAHKVQSNQSFRAAGIPVNLGQIERYPVIWRPWVLTHREVGKRQEKIQNALQVLSIDVPKTTIREDYTSITSEGSPEDAVHWLCMPKSRTQEYLSHLGKKVLASFPIQATLHFYNDDSSSEEEELEVEEPDVEETERPAAHVEKTLCSCSAEPF